MNEYIEDTAKEADIINGTDNTITLSTDIQVYIYKCKVKQIGEVLRFLAYLMKSMGMKDLADQPTKDLSNPTELMMLIADGSDQIYPVATSLCSLSMEEFTDLDIEDAIAIMMAEWELNKGFFLHKIMPMLGRPITPKSPTSKASKRKGSTRKKRAS